MTKTIRSNGHGLCAAGVVLVGMYFLALSLKGVAALHDALDPFTVRNYLVLALLVPGALVLWMCDFIAARRRKSPATSTEREDHPSMHRRDQS
jgi:hypothetical protein